MKIGVVGSGKVGGALGCLWAAAGHKVMFSSRRPASLQALASRVGASVGSPAEAMSFGEVVLDAAPFAASLALPADALAGKTMITAANYYPQRDGRIVIARPSQSEMVAARVPHTRVVKAFNMMFADEMQARADGHTAEPLAIFLAGDDDTAKAVVAGLVRAAHFAPVDVGPLAEGVLFQNDGPLYAQRWTEDEARVQWAAQRRTR
jgi:8-hydroxy-5-deazaflavin:NADPH oxidoreductase